MSEPSPSRPPSDPAPYQRWFAELKRRRVFRVIAVYGAVSFVVLEAADVIFPAVPLPAWTVSLVLWLLISCFPIAMVLAWAFEVTPEGVRRTASSTPEEIDAIVAAPARARWPSGLLALGGLALLAVAFFGGRFTAAPPSSDSLGAPAVVPEGSSPGSVDRPAIAVLPFADMSPAGDQKYFSDGISEEILTVLSRIRDLRVVSRSSAFAYEGHGADLRVVGAELGVPYLVAGSVRKDGDQLRITAELVRAADATRLWTETYDRRLENVFAIQTEIAEAVSGALQVPLGLEPEALLEATSDTDAHDLYLNARAALRSRGAGVGEAILLLEAAVARDSAWAPAWAGLAEAHAIYPMYGEAKGESTDSAVWATHLAAAERAAHRALTLDPRNAHARIALGGSYRDRWQWAEAERELLAALELDPDNEEARLQYSELLWGMGRLDEAMLETGRALALDQAPVFFDVHGFTSLMNGRVEQAEALLEEGLAKDTAGHVHFLRTVLADLMLFDGRYEVALDRFSDYLHDSTAYRMIGEALAAGDPALMPDGAASRGTAPAWALLGRTDRALDVLHDAVFQMPYRVQWEIWHPMLEPVWDTPRFQDVILPRVRLEGAVPRFAPVGAP